MGRCEVVSDSFVAELVERPQVRRTLAALGGLSLASEAACDVVFPGGAVVSAGGQDELGSRVCRREVFEGVAERPRRFVEDAVLVGDGRQNRLDDAVPVAPLLLLLDDGVQGAEAIGGGAEGLDFHRAEHARDDVTAGGRGPDHEHLQVRIVLLRLVDHGTAGVAADRRRNLRPAEDVRGDVSVPQRRRVRDAASMMIFFRPEHRPPQSDHHRRLVSARGPGLQLQFQEGALVILKPVPCRSGIP
mmetsp:Transcript_13718/g.44748  ORF Transcript_13718/g.44748 Transcript_13718/m.44748 type:complete len:245 (+) Transcript_13718:1967-2701(+)